MDSDQSVFTAAPSVQYVLSNILAYKSKIIDKSNFERNYPREYAQSVLMNVLMIPFLYYDLLMNNTKGVKAMQYL